jgi:hypothetical protein
LIYFGLAQSFVDAKRNQQEVAGDLASLVLK